jgi:hypothetical protein
MYIWLSYGTFALRCSLRFSTANLRLHYVHANTGLSMASSAVAIFPESLACCDPLGNAALVQDALLRDPYSGAIYVFRAKRVDRGLPCISS